MIGHSPPPHVKGGETPDHTSIIRYDSITNINTFYVLNVEIKKVVECAGLNFTYNLF